MWEMGREVKATMKEEVKKQQKKQTAVLCPGCTESHRYFLQKQHFLHIVMGMWAFLFFWMNFSCN